jgi:hypothetical protein
MSYLERKASMEDYLKECEHTSDGGCDGIYEEEKPQTSHEILNLYLMTKLNEQEREIASLNMELECERNKSIPNETFEPIGSYCGQESAPEIADEVFYNIGAAMIAQSEERISMEEHDGDVTEVWEPEPVVQEENTIEKYNAARELQNLAVFFKFHYDYEKYKKDDDECECEVPKRAYCGQYEKECVEWLLSDESSYWFCELFQRPVQKSVEFLKEAKAKVEDTIQRTSSVCYEDHED